MYLKWFFTEISCFLSNLKFTCFSDNLGQKFMGRRALANFFPIAYSIVTTPRSPLSMLVFNVSIINIVML